MGIESISLEYKESRKLISARELEASAALLAKAVVNHMYIIHVTNAQSDYYVLIHVDALVKNDRCVITWKQLSDLSSPKAPPS